MLVSAKMLESELYKSLSLSFFGEDKTLFLWGNNEVLSCTSPEIENVYLKMGKKSLIYPGSDFRTLTICF